MTWSYSGNPSSSDLDMVRFLIGDTITADQLLQNEEITSVLVLYPNPILAAAMCAQAIAGKYSRLASVKVGKTSIEYQQKAAAYLKLVETLNLQYKKSYKAKPFAGGISQDDKTSTEDNTDRVNPFFERNMLDNPETEDQLDPLRSDY